MDEQDKATTVHCPNCGSGKIPLDTNPDQVFSVISCPICHCTMAQLRYYYNRRTLERLTVEQYQRLTEQEKRTQFSYRIMVSEL